MAARMSILPDKTVLTQSNSAEMPKPVSETARGSDSGGNLMQLNDNDMFGLEFDRIRQKNELEQQQQQQNSLLYQPQMQNFHLKQQQQIYNPNNNLIRQGNPNFYISNNNNFLSNTTANTFNSYNSLNSNINNYQILNDKNYNNYDSLTDKNTLTNVNTINNLYKTHMRSHSCNNINCSNLYVYIPPSGAINSNNNLNNNTNNNYSSSTFANPSMNKAT